jgi:hypothetical protein
MMAERSLSVNSSTIWRGVQRYGPELNASTRRELKPTDLVQTREDVRSAVKRILGSVRRRAQPPRWLDQFWVCPTAFPS